MASAAYGTEDTVALEILGTTKSENGLVVGIILRPFSFEGQRRQGRYNFIGIITSDPYNGILKLSKFVNRMLTKNG